MSAAKVWPEDSPDIEDKKPANEQELIREVEDSDKEEDFLEDFFDDEDIGIPITVKELLIQFGSYVTIDGIGKIIESQTRLRRIMWIIVVIAMAVWGTYQCVMVSLEYFSYPKTVTINVVEETKVEFPAITICNLNPLPNKDKLKNHMVWGAFIQVEEEYSEFKNCDMLAKGMLDEDDYYNGTREYSEIRSQKGENGTPVSNTNDGNTADGNAADGNTADGNAADGNTTDGNAADYTANGNAADGNTTDNQEYPGSASLIEETEMVDINATGSNATAGDTEGSSATAENSTDPIYENYTMGYHEYQYYRRRKRETPEDPIADSLDVLDGKRDGLLNISYYQKLIHYIVSLASGASEQNANLAQKTTTKTYTLEDIVKIREECSNYYKYLSYVKNESNTDEQPKITFAATKDKRCALMSDFKENVTFNILCNKEVFCDNFGCYDYSLKVYGQKRRYNGSEIFICPSCANDDTTWPNVSYNENVKYCGMNSSESKKCPSSKNWENCLSESDYLIDWRDGNLTFDQVIGSFNTSKTKDFSDIMGMYFPTKDDIEKYSVRKQEFILSCSYDQRSCNYKGFYEWASDSYGMCYTFNSAYNKVEVNNTLVPGVIRKTTSYGPKNGLRLTLDINADQYISMLSADIGARVIVHSPNLIPFPSEEGFNVPPGVSISVGIKRKKLIRVGPPHGQCTKDPGSKLLKEYSATRCKRMCVEKEYWRLCGCYRGVNLAYNGTSDELRPPQQCSVFNVTQKMCMEKVGFLYQQGVLICDCFQACKEMKYMAQVTPSEENKVFYTLVQNLKKINTDVCSNDTSLNTVRLHFYLDSLNHETIEESPTYTFDMFISNIGNNLGLFIGMSLLTFIEMLEFMLDLSVFCGLNAFKARQQSNKVIKVTSARNQRFDSKVPPVYTTHPLKVDGPQVYSY